MNYLKPHNRSRSDLRRLPPVRRLPLVWLPRHEPQVVGHPAQGLHLHLQGPPPEGQQRQVQPRRTVDRLRRRGGRRQGESEDGPKTRQGECQSEPAASHGKQPTSPLPPDFGMLCACPSSGNEFVRSMGMLISPQVTTALKVVHYFPINFAATAAAAADFCVDKVLSEAFPHYALCLTVDILSKITLYSLYIRTVTSCRISLG